MFCKWCGLESETTDVCSWCRKPFATSATPKQAPPPTPPPPSASSAPQSAASAPGAPPVQEDLPPAPAARPVTGGPGVYTAPPTRPQAGGGMPLGDSFDDMDDDLSPMPFGGGGFSPGRSGPLNTPGAPSVPPAVPPVNRSAAPPPPAYTPPVRMERPDLSPPPTFTPPSAAPPAAGQAAAPAADTTETSPPGPATAPVRPSLPPSYMPPATRPSDDRPALEAIPIKLKQPGGGNTPSVLPLKTPPGRPTVPPVTPPSTPSTASPNGSSPVGTPLRPTPSAPVSPPASTPPPPVYRPPAGQPAAPTNTTETTPVQRVGVPLGDVPTAPIEAKPYNPLGDDPKELGLKPLVEEPHDDSGITSIPAPATRRLDMGVGAPPPSVRTSGAPSPPPRTPTTVVPPRGGRTWFCRYCGMESDSPDSCTWCHRDLRGTPNSGKPAQITTTHGPTKGKGPVRQPVVNKTNKKRNEPAGGPDLLKEAEARNKTNGTNGAAAGTPQIGTFQAVKSKYYGDQVYDPVSGKHYDADTGKTTDTPVEVKEYEDSNDLKQLAIYAGAFVVLLAVVYGLGSAIGGSVGMFFAILGIASFLAGMSLPLFRVAPFEKDDPEDVGWALGLTVLFGPFAGTMGYGVLGVVRQSANPAIIGVFVTSLLLRGVLDLATGHSLSKMVPFAEMSGLILGAQVMPLVTLAGWYAAEMFHPADE